jgi:hypothetical protein
MMGAEVYENRENRDRMLLFLVREFFTWPLDIADYL